jgi:Tfp pilus assembly protein PilF
MQTAPIEIGDIDTSRSDAARCQAAAPILPRWRFWQRAGTGATIGLPALVCIVVFAVVPYLNTTYCGFTWDDTTQIFANPVVVDRVDPFLTLASPLIPGNLYRPLTTLTFAVNYAVTPGNGVVFHATNVALHALVSLLVCVFAMQLFGNAAIALIAGLLFAVHPIHTEAVTSIVGRAEELASLFGLTALIAAVRMEHVAGPGRRRAWHALSVIAFGCGLLSKESALTVLPLIILVRVARRDGSWLRGLWIELRSLDWLPYALTTAIFLGLRGYAVGSLGHADTVTPLDNILAFVPASIRLRSALGVLWDYFGLLNFPLLLSTDYSHPQVAILTSWWEPRCLAGLLLGGVALVTFVRSRRPALAFAAVFPFVALALTANIVLPIGTPKAERLLYLPSVGWALVAAYAIERLRGMPRYRTSASLVLALVLGMFAVRTWTRNWDWRNGNTLSLSAVQASPDSAKARFNYGIALLTNHHTEEALHELKHSLALYPWWERPAFNVGVAYEALEQVDAAIAWYTHALALAPGDRDANRGLCRLLFFQRHYAAAAAACRRGLRYAPGSTELLNGVGASLGALGENQRAIGYLERSLVLDGSNAAVREQLKQLQNPTPPSA